MKKILSLIALSCALLLTPQKSHAVGGCLLYWVPNIQFFQAGGVIRVVPVSGNPYWIDKTDVVPGDHYSLSTGDDVYISFPSCALWQWGTVVFCSCNNSGGVDCGSPQAQGDGGLTWLHLRAWAICDCPNGQSSGGLHWISAGYCQAQPPVGGN